MSQSNPTDPKRPDLDDSMNVTAAHQEVMSEHATTAREKRIRENGMEPISLWVILAAAGIAMIAGSLVGQGPGVFQMGDVVSSGYTTAAPPSGGAIEIPPMEAKLALMKRGEKIYGQKCIGCHGGGGLGSADYPPLAGSEWVNGESQRFSMIILHGLEGPINVNGTAWNSKMPSQKSGLTAGDLAALMTYVRNSFGNNSSLVSPAQAQYALDLEREATGAVNVAELNSKHKVELEGDTLDADTLVDYETLQPAE